MVTGGAFERCARKCQRRGSNGSGALPSSPRNGLPRNTVDKTVSLIPTFPFHFSWEFKDASMKVSLAILRRVYDSFQNGVETGQVDEDFLDPENHLHFIDAYEMPLWSWSNEKGTFER